VLYFPAVLAEQTGHFSSIQAPAAIEVVELIRTAVALILVGVGIWTLRRAADEKSAATP
jgi:predicted transporter